MQVNSTAITPQPTYPSETGVGSLALLDMYVFSPSRKIVTGFSYNFYCRGTPGMYGPYDDVSNIYSLMPGSRLVDPSEHKFHA